MGSFDRGILTYQSITARIGSTGGYANLSAGTSTLAGYLELYSYKGIRQGYIGRSTSLATTDAGDIPYVAGTHTFIGTIVGTITALKSATTSVDVSAATAPSSGQVLTATSSTTATWQAPAGGAPDFLLLQYGIF